MWRGRQQEVSSGAGIRFIFVTDGSASHSIRLDMEAQRITGEDEAIEAVCRLGGSADRVRFLRVPDGMAKHHVGKIEVAIAQLLFASQPRSVYITHMKAPPADHVDDLFGGSTQSLRRSAPVHGPKPRARGWRREPRRSHVPQSRAHRKPGRHPRMRQSE
ncbi:PIG-L family deacetylase [Mesorhizobium sp.]|uniref:PIG-L family deacetylase n=1 Tax=Mesorhizobium sp. TaxID=1871066 RepID=UPI0025BB5D36|nr:PIG-L family deacetylase [Mesorhizobium sp.]